MSCFVFSIAYPGRGSDTRTVHRTGNKATLITRLQEHGRAQAVQTPPPVTHVRHASTTEAPSASSSSTYPKEYLDVKIPDVSIPIVQKLAPVVCLFEYTMHETRILLTTPYSRSSPISGTPLG